MSPLRRSPFLLALGVSLFSAVGPAREARASWPHDPSDFVALAPALGDTYLFGFREAVSDGQGGVIAVYDVIGTTWDVYAQRVDASGNRLWGASGVAAASGPGNQDQSVAISDGQGGIIFAWADDRAGAANTDIYAQRVNANGVPLWGTGGVAVCTQAGNQTEPAICSDGLGGVVVTWTDARVGPTDIYARFVNQAGVAQGAAAGITICTAASGQVHPRIVPSFGTDYIVVWQDGRSDGGDIYAQKFSTNTGTVAWAANGVAMCTALNTQEFPEICRDGQNGAVAVWWDFRSATTIYAQRISSSGTTQYAANGIQLGPAAGSTSAQIVEDGEGGAIVAWTDFRSVPGDIYAQRIELMTGLTQWTSGGAIVCTALGQQAAPSVAPDGRGGAYVVWQDTRSGVTGLYGQHLEGSFGARFWTQNGVPIATGSDYSANQTLVSRGPEGVFVAFFRFGVGPSTAALQRVDGWGYLGAEPALVSVRDVPNDQGGKVVVSWNASPLDTDPLLYSIYEYRIFRAVPTTALAVALRERGSAPAAAWTPGAAPPRAPLLAHPERNGTFSYWEYVATTPANHLDTYSLVAPTASDSVAGSNPLTSFMVQARGNGVEFWNSNPDSGYSVDDLAPAMPAPFAGAYSAGATVLAWGPNGESDLAYYRLYRGHGVGFVPGPANFVADLSTTSFTDSPGSAYLYKLVAVDLHGNVSPPALAIPGGTLPVEDVAPSVDFLAPAAPTPLRTASATLRFGMERAGHARLELFDALGRRVRTLFDAEAAAGEHRVVLERVGRDGIPLSPGLYLARLETARFRATRRIVVVD